MVITGRRNGESRSSKFKKAPADLADFGRFFTENPKNFKKQTGKHRVNDGIKNRKYYIQVMGE